MRGVVLQHCFLRWLVPASRRRISGARHPVSGQLGVYRFLPFGLGPSSSSNDGRVNEVKRVSRDKVPSMRIIDFVGDLRVMDVSGAHDELFVGVTKFAALSGLFGVRRIPCKNKHWWPTRTIPRFGFTADTGDGVVRIEDKKVSKGMSLCHEIPGIDQIRLRLRASCFPPRPS